MRLKENEEAIKSFEKGSAPVKYHIKKRWVI